MSPETLTLIWLVGGLVVALAEFVIPGTLVSFLGAAAMLVGGLRWLGLIESMTASFVTWLVVSLTLVVSLRGVVQRWSKPERRYEDVDEDAEAFGAKAKVVTLVTADSDGGRIRFRGTSWPARAMRGELQPGTEVRILHRDNLIWIVEPLAEIAAGGTEGAKSA